MESSRPASVPRKRKRRVAKENRKRAERACERCQDRKIKCIETEQGACQRCSRMGMSCRYARERDSTPTPASLTDHDFNNPRSTTTTHDISLELLSPEHQQIHPQGGHNILIADGFDQSSSSRAGESFIQDHTSVRGKTRNADPSVDGFMQRASGEDSRPSTLLSKLREAMFLPPHQLETGYETEQSTPEHAIPSRQELEGIKKALQKFPPKQVADFLSAICVDLGTDCFFYHNQKMFKHELDQLYADPSCGLRVDCNFICQALMKFALGSQFTALVSEEANSKITAQDQDPGWEFYEAARQIIPFVLESSTLRSIQACFMMGVYLLPAKARGTAYMYTGMAMRMAIANGLHQKQLDPALGDEEREIRHRTWWAVYSLERTISIKLNLHPTFPRENIQTPLPQRMAALDQDEPFDNVDHQIANSRLVLLLNDITENSSNSSKDRPPFERLLARLQDWKRSLPVSLQLQHITQSMKGFRTVIHLHQNYRYGWIILCKASLLKCVRRRLHGALVDPISSPQQDDQVEVMARHCARAATKILQLFERLYVTGSVSRFSFTDFQGVSIATIVLLLASILGSDTNTTRMVEFGLDCLRSLAAGNSSAEMGVDFVQEFRDIVNEATEKLQSARATTFDSQSPDGVPAYTTGLSTNEYNAWLSWFSSRQSTENTAGLMSQFQPPDMSSLVASAQDVPPVDESATQTVTPADTDGIQFPTDAAYLDSLRSSTSHVLSHRAHEPNRFMMNERPGNEDLSLLDLTGFDVLNWAQFPI